MNNAPTAHLTITRSEGTCAWTYRNAARGYLLQGRFRCSRHLTDDQARALAALALETRIRNLHLRRRGLAI